MDQTQFDVLQTTLQVVSELQMASSMRLVRGEQFPLTLMVRNSENSVIPYDIYVDRLQPGESGVVHETKVSKTKLMEVTASIEPGGEKFSIELVLGRSKDPSQVRPVVLANPEMFQRIRTSLDQQFENETVELFLDGTDPTSDWK